MSLNADINAVARVEIKKALAEEYLGFDYGDKSDAEILRLATERVLNSIRDQLILTSLAPQS